MIKYIVISLATISEIEVIKESEKLHKIFLGVVTLECIYECYWDIFEDWGLLYGGSSGKKYRDQKDKWQYSYYVKRPSNLPLYFIIVGHIIDYTVRLLWIIDFTHGTEKIAETFWYKQLYLELEIFRRLIWIVIRMDNQQSTNAEGYAKVSNIPAVAEYDIKKSIEFAERKELNSINELNTVFNEYAGHDKVTAICEVYRQLKLSDLPQKLSNFENVMRIAHELSNNIIQSNNEQCIQNIPILELEKYKKEIKQHTQNIFQKTIAITANKTKFWKENIKPKRKQKKTIELKNSKKDQSMMLSPIYSQKDTIDCTDYMLDGIQTDFASAW
ncbi:EXS_family protein [Hexamita inflata]|uniref:EXS family protein n=1 Tax=Hexamita inflata TaxID=28002 RepID=A0AA86QZL5_9EUKA|nr:EXS family protein [Hexamita inflata]